MIRKLIILLVCLLPILASAQTIHWLTFVDTTDPNVGKIDVNGHDVLYNHVINVVNSAIKEKGYTTDIHDIYGTTLTPQKCKETISNLSVSSNDVVVFYYIGHGTHGTVGGDVWPMMWMAQDNPNYLIPLKWVHDQLKAKGARLTATIGMCCNVYQGINRTSIPSFGVNYGNTYLTDDEKNAIQKMFLGNKGDFILSSASPGQSSVGGNTPLGPMDLFTCVFVKNFEDSAYDGELDWNTLFTDVKDVINSVTEGEQTPIFVANLNKVSTPTAVAPKSKPVVVTQPTPTDATSVAASNQDLLNQIGVAFDNLIDVRQSDSNRILQAKELEKIFSSNAVVKVMGQDGNIVIDKSSAEDFIGRLATSRILLKVTPVNVVVSGSRISELKVKETYKK
jgi:hypothetical protein